MDWAISGVNTSSSSGGPACRYFMSDSWRLIESVFVISAAVACVFWGLQRLSLPKSKPFVATHDPTKIFLLVLFSITLGVEIGFKLASKTVIYLLNPCHVMTIMQVSI